VTARARSLALLVVALVAAPERGAFGGAAAPSRASEPDFHAFPFCKKDDYPLTLEEVRWCALLPQTPEAPDPRCPRLAAVCAQGARARSAGRRSRFDLDFSLGGLAIPSGLVWILVGLGVAVVVVQLLRRSVDVEAPLEAEPPRPGAPGDDAAARLARQVETDVERLLARARAAGAVGDWAGGVADAYAALLRKLEGGGLVRVAPDRTNGDHLREVSRKRPEAAEELRPIVRAVERVQFAGAAPDEASFHFVLDGVVRMLTGRLAAWAPLVVGLSLAAALSGCRLDREGWDESPSGQAAVLDLLQRSGFEARERLASLHKLGDKGAQALDVLVLMPEVVVGAERLAEARRVDGRRRGARHRRLPARRARLDPRRARRQGRARVGPGDGGPPRGRLAEGRARRRACGPAAHDQEGRRGPGRRRGRPRLRASRPCSCVASRPTPSRAHTARGG